MPQYFSFFIFSFSFLFLPLCLIINQLNQPNDQSVLHLLSGFSDALARVENWVGVGLVYG